MERGQSSLRPRKACDLCYRRKIKCDGERPRCSNCVTYNSDCTYKAASRKVPSRKQATLQRQHEELDLQSRVRSLESQLGSVLEKLDILMQRQDSSSDVTSVANENEITPVSMTQPEPVSHSFPSLHEALPIVERYLATFNSLLPLFHPATLLQKIRVWYEDPESNDPVTWGVINVVLALAHHTGSMDDRSPVDDTTTYLNNAQSVLTEIIMRDTDLASVQVLLGIVIMFWTAENLGPALIFVGTALRLAHKLRLHTKKGSEHCNVTERLQRDRVFWVAYILDRDISLQSRLAPLQLNNEVDLDLPPRHAEDDLAGFIFAADGHTKMNFFRARVELANIQGIVYDCVYSTSAQSLGAQQTSQNVAYIMQMLDKWSSQIPYEFQPATISQYCVSSLSRYFCILYSTHLSCRALLCFGSSSDSYPYSRWMARLEEYGSRIASGQGVQHVPSPLGWQALVDASREYMKLFKTVTLKDTFFKRMTLCAHNSSLISLTANRLFQPQDYAIDTDKQITKVAMRNLEEIAMATESKDTQSMWDFVKKLCLYADLISTPGAFANHRVLTAWQFQDLDDDNLQLL
ncbi:fungal-specific transcription factor domain-containing protein [Xylaria arbuscula]|nr:fungal-specific transcription factor domain-containing protein [Xylaria arbuscula]